MGDEASMIEHSDEHLMRLVRNGELEALDTIYDRYERPLMSLFVRHAGSVPAAEDLIQEVFLRILKYRASYDPQRRFRSWIFRIAHNAAIDWHERESERPLPVESDGSAHQYAGHETRDPLTSLEAERVAGRVSRALGDLRDADRRVLLLAKVQELSYADIGEVLGCSEGAVKVRVHRALKRLAAALEAREGKEGDQAI